jgi:hypothetical protein
VPEPIFMKLGIMAPEPISMAYFINLSHQYVYPPIVARQRLGKNVTATTNTRSNRTVVGRVVFYAVHVISKGSRVLVLPITSCSLCIGFRFTDQHQAFSHIFTYRLVLLRNFCLK